MIPELIPRDMEVPDFDLRPVAGIDEAGRGSLAGPVVAAAVVFHPGKPVAGCADSKTLNAAQREALSEKIKSKALAWAVAHADVGEIARLNILNATLLAMARAVEALVPAPALALVDGNRRPPIATACCAVVGGDARVACIAAASILAKTARDAEMVRLHRSHPVYNFASHKGYATREHFRALAAHGACREHRTSWHSVREAAAQSLLSFAKAPP